MYRTVTAVLDKLSGSHSHHQSWFCHLWMLELQARVTSYSINGCEILLALAEQQFDWGFDNKHLCHSGLGHVGAEPSQSRS